MIGKTAITSHKHDRRMVDCFNPTICATEETEMGSKQAMANRLNSPKAIEQIAGVVSVQGKEFRSKDSSIRQASVRDVWQVCMLEEIEAVVT